MPISTLYDLLLLLCCAFVGNDPGDEDVDIGGNEPPISSYPSVEIEKDAAHRSSRCFSSGNSSGKLSLSYCHLCLIRSFLKIHPFER
jgi:hypothetical protein